MRLVIATNILISALLAGTSLPAHLVTRYPKIRARLAPALAGRLINELRDRPDGDRVARGHLVR